MIQENLKQLLKDSKKILNANGVEPKYIILGRNIYNSLRKELAEKGTITGISFTYPESEITTLFDLEVIVDDYQENVAYILDEENGKRIWEEYKHLKLVMEGKVI